MLHCITLSTGSYISVPVCQTVGQSIHLISTNYNDYHKNGHTTYRVGHVAELRQAPVSTMSGMQLTGRKVKSAKYGVTIISPLIFGKQTHVPFQHVLESNQHTPSDISICPAI